MLFTKQDFMKLYISDLHFYHEEVIKMDGRGFEDIHTMNQYMLEKWNEKVNGGDIVIVLGDMFWSKNADEVNYILNRLKLRHLLAYALTQSRTAHYAKGHIRSQPYTCLTQ